MIGVSVMVKDEPQHVGYRNSTLVLGDPLDPVARAHHAFLTNGEVDPRVTDMEEGLDHGRVAEAETELEAGHARLCDDQPRSSDAEHVADMDRVFDQSLGREVLAEDAVAQLTVEPRPPGGIVLGRVSVNRLVWSAVDGQVGLGITVEVMPCRGTGLRPVP